jgi:ribosomal protein L37AE/L43A
MAICFGNGKAAGRFPIMYSAKPQDEPMTYKRELRCPGCNKKYAEHYKGLVVLKCEQCHLLSVLDTDDRNDV